MPVAYHPPLTARGMIDNREVREALQEGPAYAITRTATRWHRIRAAERWIADYRPDELRELWTTWCGQSILGIRSPRFSDDPPAGDPRCGTCEGRAIGADAARPEWLFTPRDLKIPAVCPGTRTTLVVEHTFNRGTCRVCGEHVKIGALGGPYNSHWGIRRHAPGPGLVAPCPFHGWKELALFADGTVTCRCGEAPWPTPAIAPA